jgi:hypothetical protein
MRVGWCRVYLLARAAEVASCRCYSRRQICDEIFWWLWSGPRVVRWWQLLVVISGDGDVVVLDGPGPGPGPGESCSTRMLHRAPVAGRHGEHFCGSHCLRKIGLIRVDAGSWQVPSESGAQGGLHCPVVGSKCARVAAPTAARW